MSSPANRVRVGFVLLSGPMRPIPSTRIAALNVFPWLEQAGYAPELLHAPEVATETPELTLSARRIAESGVRIVVFQKVHGASAERLARELESLGVRTVFLVCDLVEPAMCEATSATATVTEFLRSLYPAALQSRIHVVHDGIERLEVVATPRDHRADAREPLRAVLVTSSELFEVPVLGVPPPWLQVTIVGQYPDARETAQRLRRTWWALQRSVGWRARQALLRAALSPRIRRVRWTADGVYDELRRADVGIVPVDTRSTVRIPGQPVPIWQIKSENRLTLKMAAGLPVVATPIPSYREVLRSGENGFFAETATQWLEALQRLRDPAERRRVGAAARASVQTRYSQQAQASALAALFSKLLASR